MVRAIECGPVLEKEVKAMKLVSSVSLALALSLGTVAMVAPQTAMAAKKEKAPKTAAPELSKEFRAAIAPAQAAAQKKDVAGAQAALAVATPLATLPDEKFFLGSVMYDVAVQTNNVPDMGKAIDLMIESGSKLPTNLDKLNLASGQNAYNTGNYQKAIARLAEADRLGSKDMNRLLLSAEANFKLNQFAPGLDTLKRAINEQKASGAAVDENWFKRGVSIAMKAKQAPLISEWSHMLVRAAPTPTNWRDALIIYRDSSKLDSKGQMDIARLMADTKSLAGERDFNDYASLALEGKLPWEAQSVLKAAMESGAVSKTSKPINDRLAEANAMAPGETAAIASDTKKAEAGGSGVYAANVANALIAQGNYTKALDLLSVAEKRGGVDANMLSMWKGISLTRLGRGAEARPVFASVQGPKADSAKFWLLYLDLKGGQ